MGKTSSGLDNETLLRMADFYNRKYNEKVEELLELTIQFHADRSHRNFLKVKSCLTYCREEMLRRQAYQIHAEVENKNIHEVIKSSFEDAC